MSHFNELFGALKKPTDTEKSPKEQKPTMSPEVTEAVPLPLPKLGRPETGKRSHPDYKQVTAYIKKQTHQAVKKALIDHEQEFSDLLQSLLDEWLENQRRDNDSRNS